MERLGVDAGLLVPMEEPTLDAILAAYARSGLRVVFSALRDRAALDVAPSLPVDAPAPVRALVAGAPANPCTQPA